VGVPTSVLLAVLAAAGLLALAPALVRRYDATERLAAERAQSAARVLDRRRRRRTVPGPKPRFGPRSTASEAPPAEAVIVEAVAVDEDAVEDLPSPAVREGNGGRAREHDRHKTVWLPVGQAAPPPVAYTDTTPSPGAAPATGVDGVAIGRARPPAASRAFPVNRTGPSSRNAGTRSPAVHRDTVRITLGRQAARRPPRTARRRQNAAVYRRRRVLASLVLFNAVELVGVFTVGPGFWTGFAVTSIMLIGYVVHLRNEALVATRRRRVEAQRAAAVAAVQAEIRAEQARRAIARREALTRAAAARTAARRDAVGLTQRYVDFDPSRRARVRGRSYETSGWDGRAVGQ
jgi:hypothetical protein